MNTVQKKICIFVLCLLLFTNASAEFEIHFLDVGEGDSAIVLCDGEIMIIDGGLPSASQKVYSYLRNTLSAQRIKYMIATHPDDDHIGGLAAVLNATPVELILSPTKASKDNHRFQDIVTYAKKQGTPIYIPYPEEQYDLGSATITILACNPNAKTPNSMSICLRIDYVNTSFLFMADAEEYDEYMLDMSGLPLEADVLKVGHHGSNTSCSTGFLAIVHPSYAVISCGTNNRYKHPHQTTLNSLQNMGIQLYRTDLQGTIICKSDGNSVEFYTEKTTQENIYAAPK